MMTDNARVIVTGEEVTRIVRVAWEKLTKHDIEMVFGTAKAKSWQAGHTDFVRLWYYASAIEQAHLLDIMNAYITDQPIHLSRGETI